MKDAKFNQIKLGDLGICIRGVSYSPDDLVNNQGLGVTLLRANNIADGKLNFDDIKIVKNKKVNKEKFLKKNDIVICMSSGSRHLVGKNAQFKDYNFPSTVGAFCSIFRPKDVYPEWIRFFFKSKEYQRIILKKFRGVNINNLKNSDVEDINIKLPLLEDQKHIVKILDQVDALSQKRKKAIVLLDEYLKAVFLEMFGDPVTNPKGWEQKDLKNLTTKIGSGATPRGGKSAYIKEGIALIRSMNIHDNKFLHKDLAFIDNTQASALSNVVVETNDVLLNITGASVCRSVIVDSTILPARVNQHVSILRPKKEVLNSNYLLHLLIFPSYKQKLLKIATSGGATREALTKLQIEQLNIPVPPINLQEKFSLICEIIKKTKKTMLTQAQELNTQFQALMQRAFKT